MDVRAKQRLCLLACPLKFSLRVGGFAPRHLSRYVAQTNFRFMKRTRIIAFVVLLLSLIYLTVAAISYQSYRSFYEVFANYGISYEQLQKMDDVNVTGRILFGATILFSIASFLTLIAAIGLFFAKDWARKFWLSLALLLTVFHIARLIADVFQPQYILAVRFGEIIIIGIVTVVSWRQLTKEKTNIFQSGV